jgi:hypothetical protein
LISTQGALSVKLRNGQDVDPAHLSPSAGFFGSAANMFRRKPSELEAPPSAANPSVLCGEQIETETDVLYVQKMPTFDGSLGAADAELVCSYLTAPYLRIPLLLQFFSAPARFAALGCVEMQRVLDAALFEPGAYVAPDVADAWFAPAPEKRHNAPSTAPAPKEKLATTLGLLVNELHRSPDMLVAARVEIEIVWRPIHWLITHRSPRRKVSGRALASSIPERLEASPRAATRRPSSTRCVC